MFNIIVQSNCYKNYENSQILQYLIIILKEKVIEYNNKE